MISYLGTSFQKIIFEKDNIAFAWGWEVPANQDPKLQKTEGVGTITCRKEEIETFLHPREKNMYINKHVMYTSVHICTTNAKGLTCDSPSPLLSYRCRAMKAAQACGQPSHKYNLSPYVERLIDSVQQLLAGEWHSTA